MRAFASLVGDERRLTALYLLTVAEHPLGTSPKVWNGWKGKLLEDLYNATRACCAAPLRNKAMGIANGRRRLAACCATSA